MTAQSSYIVPLIVGLVQAALLIGLPRKWAPLLAAAFGVAAGIFYLDPGNYTAGVLDGLALGLGAVGLVSTAQHVPLAFKSLGKKKPAPAPAATGSVTETQPAQQQQTGQAS